MSHAELEIAPDDVPKELPTEFEPVATVVVSEWTSGAPARATIVSLLRQHDVIQPLDVQH